MSPAQVQVSQRFNVRQYGRRIKWGVFFIKSNIFLKFFGSLFTNTLRLSLGRKSRETPLSLLLRR